MTSMPPGWYDDGHGALRWWDGAAWTEHVATPDAEVDADDSDDGALPPELAELSEAVESPAGEGGAFTAATGPQRSKLWIVWVVLGVVLLGVVIAAAVLIPLLFLNLATSSSGATAQTEEQRAAVAAVEQYNDAWLDGDCDEYFEITTEDLRARDGLVDCAAFEAASAGFVETVEDYRISVTALESADDAVTVETSESYGVYFDEDGQPVDEARALVDRLTYIVVADGDLWVIDEVLS